MNVMTDREFSITRLIDVPRARLFEAWTRPDLLARWFAPKPNVTSECRLDPRPGGEFSTVMRSPEGEEFGGVGVFLEVVQDERIVWTDAFLPGWIPKPDPFLVATISLEDEDGRTRYTATARHWTVEACRQHAAMGFEAGWNQCLDQLIELAASEAF